MLIFRWGRVLRFDDGCAEDGERYWGKRERKAWLCMGMLSGCPELGSCLATAVPWIGTPMDDGSGI